ncbi:hypothetical protein T439DRAFT_30046 [Meredithblackwellia eburnea MCA 4105]
MSSSGEFPPFVKPPRALILNIGSLFIGVGFSILLLGVLSAQSIRYYTETSWRRHEPFLKCLVALILLSVFLSTTTVVIGLFQMLIENFGNYEALTHLSIFIRISTFASCFPGILSMFWLLHRVFAVSRRNKVLFGLLLGPVVGSAFLNLYQTVIRLKNPLLDNKDAGLIVVLPLTLCWTMGTDFLLSGSFIYWVYRDSNRALHATLRDRLRELANHAIQACVPTTICAMLALILSRVLTGTTLYVPFQVSLGPLYAMSMLYTLNSRPSAHAVSSNDFEARSRPGAPTLSLRRGVKVELGGEEGADKKEEGESVLEV